MKKLLGIIVLGLLWCDISLAEKISFKNCFQEPFEFKFDPKVFESNEVIIDTDIDKLTMILNYSDSAIESQKKKTQNFNIKKLQLIVTI